ncbi:MAG: LysR family transcriptional regulator [Gammaproteobacteria bacterium]|nr:LysR family transcriptional regulator [Gammaproteobacteria bacterium]
MNITFRQLQVFEAVARRLSFTQAAEELFLTQPAVSMQVRQLENVVGIPLYEQLGKRIHLTEAGKLMLRYRTEIRNQVEEANKELNDLKGTEGGHLQITVASTVNYFAARLLSEFCQQYPRIRVSFDVTNRATLLKQLESNNTDLALMGSPPGEMELIGEPFMDNPLVIIAPPNHPLVDEKDIPLRKLKDDPLIMREVGSGTRVAMERFFMEKKNFKLISTIEMNSNEAIKQSVEAGLGLGIVSMHTIELEIEVGRLKVLDVRSFPIVRRWYIVHRKGKRLSIAAESFRNFVLAKVQTDT